MKEQNSVLTIVNNIWDINKANNKSQSKNVNIINEVCRLKKYIENIELPLLIINNDGKFLIINYGNKLSSDISVKYIKNSEITPNEILNSIYTMEPNNKG